MPQSYETTVAYADTPNGPMKPPAHIRRLMDHVVNADRRYFIAHPGVTVRERRYIPGEAWPHEPDDANRVTVIRLSESQQARCYYRRDDGDV